MRGGSGAGALRRVTEAASPVPTPVTAPEGIRPRKESSFAGDVLKMVSGTTIAQGIGVLATPLLTRMYGPEAFGTLALFTSITGIIGVVACLRYELAIMLPESDEEAANLLAVSLLSVVGVTLLTIPAVTWGRGLIVRLLNAPDLGPYLWAVPVAVFFGGVFQALNYWSSRKKRFARVSAAKVVNSGLAHGIKIAAGVSGRLGGGVLISGSIVGSSASAIWLAGRLVRQDSDLLRAHVRSSFMWDEAVRYSRFASVDVWSSLLNTVSAQLPTLMLSLYFSPAVVGQYSLSHRVLSLPMALVGASLGQVFYQRASVAKVAGTLAQVVEDTSARLVTLVGLPFILLAIVSPDIFGAVFGSSWHEAGVYGRIISPWLLFVFLGSPISTLYCVMERQQVGLLFSAVLLVTRAGSLAAGGLLNSPRMALAIYAASGTLLWAGFCVYLFRLVGLGLGRFITVVLQRIWVAILFATPVLAIRAIYGSELLWITISCVASMLGYSAWLLRSDSGLLNAVKGTLDLVARKLSGWQSRRGRTP